MIKCKETFEPLKDKEFSTFVAKSVEILEEYDDCAIRHNQLVDFINNLEKVEQ